MNLDTMRLLGIFVVFLVTGCGQDQVVDGEMNEDRFWSLVESAKSAAKSTHDRPNELLPLLEDLSPAELEQFDAIYMKQLNRSYTWSLWGAAYVMNGGCSDDCFDYFRDWLISEGRQTFDAALAEPDTLAELPRVYGAELELFRYVHFELYEKKVGKMLEPNYEGAPLDPAGEPWDEDEVYALFPKLARIY
ncbi:MAG: DUF4240 domain-containing protein [Pseudomonadota bacterium]